MIVTTVEAQRALTGASGAALAELERLLAPLARGASADTVRDALLELLPDLAAKWGDAAASLAADFYEAKRSEIIGRSFTATLANPGDTAPLARWAVDPLYSAEPDFKLTAARVLGGFQKVIGNTYRDTIETNVARDKAAVGWARHASASACTFCRLMATRGAVYKSEAAATRVSGFSLGGKDYANLASGSTRESYAGRRKRKGTKRPTGSKYHDHCHCVATPIFAGETYEEAPYVQQWRDSYSEVGDSTNLKATLSAMRADMGTR